VLDNGSDDLRALVLDSLPVRDSAVRIVHSPINLRGSCLTASRCGSRAASPQFEVLSAGSP
jgi:hypothetical protein